MRKIILLEDDQGIREVMELILMLENYEVQSFASVDEFRKRDQKVLPDLFIFDVRLPDGSGIDVCNEIRKDVINDDIPVVIMSAHASIKDLKGKCAANDFIAKPFELDWLLERIKIAIN
ncbi:response regulator transcription factor [Pedobacter sp. R20-19]|uniref:response regulator transcription factor n=1 Tax=Pedobacter sp. R20-19 TaxID=1270196 RepID=UPI0004931717|nr:response regulator [Pedobacter sp. R20-19]